jgi:hypothetical protein
MGGSLRAETLPDERAVWLDFLCLANAGAGRFDCANRDSLAIQLLISRELLDRAVKKFIDAKRLSVYYDKKERKEVFVIIKWAYYQAPPRSHKKSERAENKSSSPLPPSPSFKERKIDRKRERESRGSISEASFSEKGSKSASYLSPPPDIPKNLSLEVKDVLKEKRAFILKLQRMALDDLARQVAGFTKEELKKKIENLLKNFCQAIKDRE